MLAACSPAGLYQQESFVFGTRVELQIYGVPEPTARAAAAAVLGEFDRLHRTYHAWQPSELTALNEAIARGERDIALTDEMAALLTDARQLATDSEDLFNPAMGALIRRWGFHADTFAPRVPPAHDIAGLVAAQPRMRDLVIEHKRLTSRNRAVQLDFGGYAKGYALDRARELLRQQGVQHALINIGGNILALGTKGNQPWRVGVAHPRGTGALGSVALHDGEAIGTSGDYQRYFEVGGQRYCHVLDPRTGYPASGTQAVTVLIAPGPRAGVRSDALSKPLFVAGEAHWLARAKSLGVTQVLRVDPQGQIWVTPALNARLDWTPGVHTQVVKD